MLTIKVDPKDVERVKQAFSALSDASQMRVMKDVLVKNAKPLESKMKELCPVSKAGGRSKKYASRVHPPGYLRASIGIIRSKGNKYPTIWVRPRFKGKWDPWYEHFPMAGTEQMRKKGTAPNPFVDRAWDATRATVEARIRNDMTRMIQERIDKMR